MCIVPYRLYLFELFLTRTDTQDTFAVFCKFWAFKGNGWSGNVITVDTLQNVRISRSKK